MANIQVDITTEGKMILATAGKYCDRNIDINVSVPGGIGAIPDYWKSYLETKVTEINSALTAAGENKSAFLWYTDAHWLENFGKSPMLLKYLSKHTGMNKTFFGGDIAVESSGEIASLTAWKELVNDVPNHHSVIGNHDNAVSELATAADRADFFVHRTGDMVMGTDATNGKMYYYIDNHIEKTRYICLSTGRMWTTADEIPWCIDALNGTPAGWHIVVISHLWLNSDYADDGVTLNPTPPGYIQSYLDMFDAYNYRQTGTTSHENVAYDFVNGGAKIEFIIGGHVHRDYDFATAKGIPIILTECDGRYERDPDSTATQGTTTENCVYAIVADYAANVVKVINVGRGDSRNISIPGIVTYTNWVKKAINADGTIYNNGKGYKEGYRLNSGGQEVSYTGYDITGYIPAVRGDIIRFRNVKFQPGESAYLARYRSTFEFHSITGYASASNLSAWEPVFDENGNLLQVTIPSAISTSAVYFRFSVQDINENSIITVNEKID